jgi:hypothetical protein
MPTEKQKRAAEKTLENISSDSPKSMKQILKESGYSETTTTVPTLVTESKGFQELLDEMLPDKLLTQVHNETLFATKVISAQVFPDGKDGKPVNDFIEVPDHPTRFKAVEGGYKIKGKEPAQKHEHDFSKWKGQDDETLDERTTRIIAAAHARGKKGADSDRGGEEAQQSSN